MTNLPSIDYAAKQFVRSLKYKSSHLSQAANQALTLFIQFLNKQKISATKPINTLSEKWLISFLEYLQQSRAVETEHLYTRSLLDFYHFVSLQPDWEATIDFDALSNFITSHRRHKTHELPSIPIETIQDIITYVEAASPPPFEPDSLREHLRFLRDKSFLLLLSETGLRISEICSLRRYQANLDQSQLVINADLSLSLSHITTSTLQNYLTTRSNLDQSQSLYSPEHLPLFARHDKRVSNKIIAISRWTGASIIENWVNLSLSTSKLKQLESEGIKITAQTFRHYFVITLLGTKTVNEINTLARHNDIYTTRQYLKYSEDINQSGSEDTDRGRET